MSRMYQLIKRTYGDFDVPCDECIGVSASKSVLELEAATLNSKRTQSELDSEVKYSVPRETVKVFL